MAYRCYVDRSVNCVFVQHYGTYVVREGENQAAETALNPDYEKGMNYLRDVSQTVLPPEYCLEWLREHAEKALPPLERKLGTDRKVAWVLGNPHDFKIIHQWSAVNRLNRYVDERRPFRSVESAMRWLGMPKDYVINYPEEPENPR